LAEKGIVNLVELGCGNVLTGLAPRCDERLSSAAISTVADIKNILAAAKAA